MLYGKTTTQPPKVTPNRRDSEIVASRKNSTLKIPGDRRMTMVPEKSKSLRKSIVSFSGK